MRDHLPQPGFAPNLNAWRCDIRWVTQGLTQRMGELYLYCSKNKIAKSFNWVLSEFEREPLPVHVVHREGRQASQRVRAFIDLAVERLRADASLN